MNENIIKQPPLPDTIHFNHTMDNDKTEVMRITRDGVWVNPDMAVDETAKAVLDALSSQVKVLVQKAVEEEREKVAKWMMVQGYATGHGDTVEDLLKELGWQVAPVDTVNMTPERVDETVKSEHEPLYMDMSQVPKGMPDWKPGMVFPAPKKEWVGLTRRELDIATLGLEDLGDCYLAIEAKLKEKNGG